VNSLPTLRGVGEEEAEDGTQSLGPRELSDNEEMTAIVLGSIGLALCVVALLCFVMKRTTPVMRMSSTSIVGTIFWLALFNSFIIAAAAVPVRMTSLHMRVCTFSISAYAISIGGLVTTLLSLSIKKLCEARLAYLGLYRECSRWTVLRPVIFVEFLIILLLIISGSKSSTNTGSDSCQELEEMNGDPCIIAIFSLLGALALLAILFTLRTAFVISVARENEVIFLVAILIVSASAYQLAAFVGAIEAKGIINASLGLAASTVASCGLVFRKLFWISMTETEAKEAAVLRRGRNLSDVRQFPGGYGKTQARKEPSPDQESQSSSSTDSEDAYLSELALSLENENKSLHQRSSSWIPDDGGHEFLIQVNQKYGWNSTASVRSPRGRSGPQPAFAHHNEPDSALREVERSKKGHSLEHQASTKIQATYKGSRVRAVFRNFLGFGVFASVSVKEQSATKIQSAFRGRRERRRFLAARLQLQNMAATRIQALFRGRSTRKKLEKAHRSKRLGAKLLHSIKLPKHPLRTCEGR